MGSVKNFKRRVWFMSLLAIVVAATVVYIVFYIMTPSAPVLICSNSYCDKWMVDKPVSYYKASDPAKKEFLVWTPKCKIRNLDPFDKSLSSLMGPPMIVNCSTRPPLSRVLPVDSTLRRFRLLLDKTPNALAHYTESHDIRCCYSTLSRLQPVVIDPDKKQASRADDNYKLSSCTYFEEEALLPPETEFIFVGCYIPVFSIFSKEVYANMHSMVPVKKSVSEKIEVRLNREKGLADVTHNTLSVLLLGIDATSRLNLIRKMPETFSYLKGSGWFELAGYNKVGLNTFPNIFPLLTGLRLDRSTKGTCFPSNDDVLDGCPFLWKNYSDHGFVTAYAEDKPDVSTFNFDKVGFSQQPTDYYLHTYMLVLYKKIVTSFTSFRTPCFDSVEITDHVLRYARDFVTTFKDNLFFGLFWLNNFSHDDHNNLAAFDQKFHDLFMQLHEVGVMNNTIVIFFSDHGMRFGKMAQHPIGRIEDKLPFLYIWLPYWYRKQNKPVIKNLKINGGRLTSPFDLHKTLKYNLLQSENAGDCEKWNKDFCKSSMNLFEEVPLNRTCYDACIPYEWCSCLSYKNVPKNNADGVAATNYVISRLQLIVNDSGKLSNHTRATCAQLSLKEIIKISKNAEVEEFVVQFETMPGHGIFEAIVRYLDRSTYKLVGDINRISRYGNQSWCVDDSFMKNYCYCEMS